MTRPNSNSALLPVGRHRDRGDGQVAVVTGSGRGFGRAIALGLAEQGAAVVVTARSANEIDETVDLITAAGGRAVAATCDVTKRADMFRHDF